jgi:hypothetical protein
MSQEHGDEKSRKNGFPLSSLSQALTLSPAQVAWQNRASAALPLLGWPTMMMEKYFYISER